MSNTNELDMAVTEVLGEVPCDAWQVQSVFPPLWIKESGACAHEHCYPAERGAAPYSTNPEAFARIKREIERRGWEWRCEYFAKHTSHYNFIIDIIWGIEEAWGESEELAGCRAFLEVMKKSEGK